MVSVIGLGGFSRYIKRQKQESALRIRGLEPFLKQVEGLPPTRAAAVLNERKIRSLKGGRWSASMVGAIRRKLAGRK
jgi:hypothetical protein